jgi:hypothetical protein
LSARLPAKLASSLAIACHSWPWAMR